MMLKKNLLGILKVAAVFIGTIVGAGLASGKEITQFFTLYGFKSFIGIIICGGIYIYAGSIISKISIKYNLKSYNELITLVSPGFLGVLIDFITGFFLISSSAIILAASGALLKQYFGVSTWVGIIIMVCLSIFTLMKETEGLISINSFIVPCLIITLVLIFTLYILFYNDSITISHLSNIPSDKKYWLLSALLYSGFNILCCSGVLVPLSSEIKDENILKKGIALGSLGLTILCIFINAMLLLNKPYITLYEIPLLYIANRFGASIQIALLAVIWLEMFSTEVSDIYSISQTMKQSFNLSFRKSMLIILAIAIPISQIGFSTLVSVLYPAFGAVSLVFLVQCIYFYYKNFK